MPGEVVAGAAPAVAAAAPATDAAPEALEASEHEAEGTEPGEQADKPEKKAEPAKAAEKRKLKAKIKVNGTEQDAEWDEDEAVQKLSKVEQLERAARERTQKVAAYEKQLRDALNAGRRNPDATLRALGMSTDEIDAYWQQRSQQAQQWQEMSQEQRQTIEARQEADQYRQQLAERDAAEQQAKSSQEQDRLERHFAEETHRLLESGGIPKDLPQDMKAFAVRLMAAYAEGDYLADPSQAPDLEYAAKRVSQGLHGIAESMVNTLKPEDFIKRFPEIDRKLREFHVARATGKATGQPVKPTASPAPRTPQPQQKRPPITSARELIRQRFPQARGV